jgi:hypothetical protein
MRLEAATTARTLPDLVVAHGAPLRQLAASKCSTLKSPRGRLALQEVVAHDRIERFAFLIPILRTLGIRPASCTSHSRIEIALVHDSSRSWRRWHRVSLFEGAQQRGEKHGGDHEQSGHDCAVVPHLTAPCSTVGSRDRPDGLL